MTSPAAALRLGGSLVVAVALSACSGSTAGVSPAPRPSGFTGSSATTTAAPPSGNDTALPPAAQGLEPCPGGPDHRFALSLGADRVHGLRRGTGRRVVVLTHQSRGTPCDLATLGAALADTGYRVLAWTEEPGPGVRGLRRLVGRERDLGAHWVALVGASLGAATSLVAAGGLATPPDAVVALSPASQADRSGDVARAAARYPGPLLVLAGERDPSFAGVVAQLAAAHEGPEEAEVVAGSSDHGKDFVRRRTDPTVERVVAFLDAVR